MRARSSVTRLRSLNPARAPDTAMPPTGAAIRAALLAPVWISDQAVPTAIARASAGITDPILLLSTLLTILSILSRWASVRMLLRTSALKTLKPSITLSIAMPCSTLCLACTATSK